ncbi:MAG: hypothetical protein KDJ19_00550 [Hyphomicrobiaceae bacterium]|nr:hypothetical protein [Hyphomicrobiaceae bacterium]MCC0024597.1 hypothetical protein [Hyphomicrobiaceae bacterium]
MADDLSFEDQVAISKALPEIAKTVDTMLQKAAGGKRIPFSVLTWGGHRSQYIASAARDDVKRALADLLDRWETDDDGPLHKTGN